MSEMGESTAWCLVSLQVSREVGSKPVISMHVGGAVTATRTKCRGDTTGQPSALFVKEERQVLKALLSAAPQPCRV